VTPRNKLVLPIAKCHVKRCHEEAAYGFRETIDVSIDEPEFIMGVRPNWCHRHDASQRPLYATKDGVYVEF